MPLCILRYLESKQSLFQQSDVHGSKVSSTTENTVDRLDSKSEMKSPRILSNPVGASLQPNTSRTSRDIKLENPFLTHRSSNSATLDHGIGCICLERKTGILMQNAAQTSEACHQSLTVSWYSLKWQLSTIHWYMKQINLASHKRPKLTQKSRNIWI